jgi:DNA-binding XRE family transcriptional regulator
MGVIDLTVGHVRAARGLLKWTQEELANRAGVALATIGFWETEKVRPSEETKEQVRRAFEEAGIEFLNGGNPGVRLMRNTEG